MAMGSLGDEFTIRTRKPKVGLYYIFTSQVHIFPHHSTMIKGWKQLLTFKINRPIKRAMKYVRHRIVLSTNNPISIL